MGIHRPFSRFMFTNQGSVRTSGGSKRLAKGQFTIVNTKEADVDGTKVVSNFNALPKDAVLEMRLGVHSVEGVRTNNIPVRYSSETFRLKDVVDVKMTAPQFFERTFDDYIVGFDGINNASAIALADNQTTLLNVTVKGDHVGFITGNTEYTFTVHFGKEVGETDQEVVNRVAEILKKQIFPTGVSIQEVIDIKVVDSENLPLSGTSYTFSTLTLTDQGDSNALALVQAQYPSYKVTRTDRDGLVSTYTILHPTTASLSAYTSTVAKTFKSCADCPAGYSAVTSGVVYSISIEDDGADLSTTIDNVPGFVSGTVVKVGQDATNAGRGIYTVVVDNALTDAEIATYVSTTGAQSTAQITLVGEVADVCYDNTVTSTAWVNGTSCKASVAQYKIQLADGDCDDTLTKLQAHYPNLVIEAGVPTGRASQTITLSGSSGNAVIVINGTSYTQAFDTNLTTTATAFVTAHASAILEATGATVTSSGAVITVTDNAVGFPVISGVTGGLVETIGTIDYLTTASTGGCQGVYSTTVTTSIVCDECDPIFLQRFISEAPASYEFKEWTLVAPTPNANSKMGLRLTGKAFDMTPTEYTRDSVPFYETSTELSISGGYIEEVNSSFDPQYSDPFKVVRLSRKQDRDALGYTLLNWEDASRAYFSGIGRHENNLFAKAIFGEESVLDFKKQYVMYHIYIHDSKYSQGVGRTSDMGTEYIVVAEFGRHEAVEDYINKLAVASGHNAVQASA